MQHILEEGIAEEITDSVEGAGQLDAAIVLSGPVDSLDAIYTALKPGGPLYLEAGRGSVGVPRTSRRLKARLTNAGFGGLCTYAVAPNLGNPMVYIPLEATHALKWYVRSAYDPTTVAGHAAGAIAGRSGRLARTGVQAFWANVCMTARAGELANASGLPCSLPGLPTRDVLLHPLLLCDTGNRVVILPFRSDGQAPEYILKIPKISSVNDRTAHEHHALRELVDRLPQKMRSSVPDPLALVDWNGVSIAVESFVPGTSLKQRTTSWWLPRRAKIKDLDTATGWLADFHLAVVEEHQEWPDAIRRWVREPIEAYLRAFGGVDEESRLFERALVYAKSLPAPRLPIVWQHRDFNIWNVLRDGDQIRVLDWEGLRPGPALCDLLHFATHWHEAVVGATSETDRVDAFRWLWLNPVMGDPAFAARRAVDKYLTRLQMDRRLLPLMLLYTWLELALRRAEQQRDQGSSPSDAREGNRNFAYVGVLAEGADHLFPTSF